MLNGKNYYDILGIPKNSSIEAIKQAYKSMALQYHPDKQNGDCETFKEICEAYDTLKDNEKRRNYDVTLESPQIRKVAPWTRRHSIFDEIFEMQMHHFDNMFDTMLRDFAVFDQDPFFASRMKRPRHSGGKRIIGKSINWDSLGNKIERTMYDDGSEDVTIKME